MGYTIRRIKLGAEKKTNPSEWFRIFVLLALLRICHYEFDHVELVLTLEQ